MPQEVESYASVTIIRIRVNTPKSSLELLEIVFEKLLMETSLDVLLIILYRLLLLLDQEIFGGGLALATILH